MVINLEGVVSPNWRDRPATEIFPGVRKRILWQGTNGARAQILEIAPGAKFAPSTPTLPAPRKSSWYQACLTTVSTIIQPVLFFTIPWAPRTYRSQRQVASSSCLSRRVESRPPNPAILRAAPLLRSGVPAARTRYAGGYFKRLDIIKRTCC